jgi:hypothetical protein
MRAQSATRMREDRAPKPNTQTKEAQCTAFVFVRSASVFALVVLRLSAHDSADRRQRPKGARAGAGGDARWRSDGPFNAAAALIVSEQSSMDVWRGSAVCCCGGSAAVFSLRLADFGPLRSRTRPHHRTYTTGNEHKHGHTQTLQLRRDGVTRLPPLRMPADPQQGPAA